MSEKTPLKPLSSIPSEVLCAQDYEAIAEHFIAEDRFAYICGGSGYEQTLQRNRKAFAQYDVIPRPLGSTTLGNSRCFFGSFELAHPIILAPLAHQILVHPEAELDTARAAAATDTCMVSSTLSSYSLEAIAAAGNGNQWFQLYCQTSEADTYQLIDRAQQAGFKAIMVTLDAAVQVPSARALRAGFRMPEDAVAANLQSIPVFQPSSRDVFSHYAEQAVAPHILSNIIEYASLPVFVKGVLHSNDAKMLMDLGVAGIVVSNHGGRTLDGVPDSLSVLPSIRKAVGEEFPIAFDSGVRSGQDAFKAIALGANAVMVGRLQAYALSVAGALGVAHMLKLLREELEVCMAVCGCSRVSAISKDNLWNRQEDASC